MSHTPGPWSFGISGWDDSFQREFIQKPFEYSGPGYYDNPSIFAADGTEIVGCDEYHIFRNADDARLLCAAPDLLVALEALTADRLFYYEGDTDAQMNVTVAAYDAARAAIAKARGGK